MSRIPFQKGLACYQAGNYQEALDHFNEAESHGGKNIYLILDSRAAVYAKLGQKKEALRDAKKTIDEAPERWQGYARAARVFLQLNRPDAAAKMVAMALERLKEEEVDRRTSLLALEAEVRRAQEALEKHRQRFADHTIKLPIELFAEIVKMLVEEDHRALIPLLHVRKHWRSVLEAIPSLWGTLVLTQRRPKQKAKLWIQVTGGRIHELVVREGAFNSPSWPGDSLLGLQWDHLRVCRINRWDITDHLRSIGHQNSLAHLDVLELDDDDELQDRNGFFSQSGESLPLQRLAIKGVKLDNANVYRRVNNLKSLRIEWCVIDAILLIEGNPSLEELVLNNTISSPRDIKLELKHLTLLDVSRGVPREICDEEMPELRTLRFRGVYAIHSCIALLQRLVESSHSRLTELVLSSCRLYDVDIVISLIKMSPNLQTLEVSNIASNITPIVEALSAHLPQPSNPKGTKFDQTPPAPLPPVVCPLLTHVAFCSSSNIQTGPLVRLVKSRLPQASSPTGSQDAAPSEPIKVASILSLAIDECPEVDAKWLPWFREKVPRVSCVYMPKKTKFRVRGD